MSRAQTLGVSLVRRAVEGALFAGDDGQVVLANILLVGLSAAGSLYKATICHAVRAAFLWRVLNLFTMHMYRDA